MAATVFYLAEVPGPGETAVLDGPEGHHAATVRRIRIGEAITLSDGCGVLAPAEVTAVGRGRVELLVRRRDRVPPPSPRVTVVQALPKADRSETAVELATEAGVDTIVPWQAARCVARWDTKADKGVAKWRAAALAAARQSRRAWIPEVTALHDTAAVLDRLATVDGPIVALHESATERFAALPFADAAEVVLLVGPEGGLDDRELDRLCAAGARPVLLGPTVLRTSTTAAVALGALGVLTGRWAQRPPQQRDGVLPGAGSS